MADNSLQFATRNYLVPADGTTHCVKVTLTPTPQGINLNWDSYSNNKFRFMPQGCYVDNSTSLQPVTIKIQPIGFTVTVAAGELKAVSFPAPSHQTAVISGTGGELSIFWVDYPVITSGGGGGSVGPGSVTISNTNANPVPVQVVGGGGGSAGPANTDQGIFWSGTPAGGNTQTFVSKPGVAVRKIVFSIPPNCTDAGGGCEYYFDVAVDGVIIWTSRAWLPAAGVVLPQQRYAMDFAGGGIPAGSNVVVRGLRETAGGYIGVGVISFQIVYA